MLSTKPSSAIHPIKFPNFQMARKFKSDPDRKFAHPDIDVNQRKQVNLGCVCLGVSFAGPSNGMARKSTPSKHQFNDKPAEGLERAWSG